MTLLPLALVHPSFLQHEGPDTYEVYDRLVDFGETTKSLDIRFSHTISDHTFKTVTHMKGRLYWESSTHWTLSEEPIKREGKTERVRGADYEVRSDSASCWLQDGSELIAIDYTAGRRIVLAHEMPDEMGIASIIRVMAAIPRMADFSPYLLSTRMKGGKVLVDLEPSYGAYGLGFARQHPEISVLLDPRTLRPSSVKMTDGREHTYVVQSESRNIVPANRDEILFPCPWIFEATSAQEPAQTAEDYSTAFNLIAGFVRLLVPGVQ